jgi:hypothetical protein
MRTLLLVTFTIFNMTAMAAQSTALDADLERFLTKFQKSPQAALSEVPKKFTTNGCSRRYL